MLAALLLAPIVAVAAEHEDGDKAPPLPGDIAELARKYAGVTGWQGFFDSSTTGSTASSGSNFSKSGIFEARSHGHFMLQRSTYGWDPRRGNFRWGGSNREQAGEATGTTQDQWSEKENIYGTSTEWRSEFGGTVPLFAVSFEINLLGQSGKVHMGHAPDEKLKLLQRTKTGHAVVSLSSGDGQHHLGVESLDSVDWVGNVDTPMIRTGFADDGENRLREWAIVRNGPGVLAFTYDHIVTPKENRPNDPVCTHHSRIFLFPIYDDLECEVTIEGYAKWRPEGSIEEPTKPGNSLTARATLKSKTGQVKDLPEVKYMKFQLLDTSREPGVCLNWPLGAKDQDYDLRLADEGGGKLSDSDQKLAIDNLPKDDKQQPYAEAKVNSYDFGGRATLQVICELADGREIMGLMKDEKGREDLVRLPKMNSPGWIAESWRKEHKAEGLADNDDNEKVEGQKDNGDGFTLYEEYRGWAVDQKHVEGDPTKKDFFVLNRIGLNARPGIELFEQLSQLRVRSKLRLFEMSPVDRLMNGNHRDAPHRVDQHGVWVKTFTREKLGDNGADTPMNKAGVAGRPGLTKGVGILGRSNTESIFNQPFNLPAQDAIFAYDRAIAHELLHSVGVEHHGPDDKTGYELKFIPPNVPENKIGRPHYQKGDGTVFTILMENSRDLAASVYVNYEEVVGKYRAVMMDMLVALWSTGPAGSKDPVVARKLAEASLRGAFDQVYGQRGIVGFEHASHSGNEDCVMRYYFARFYEAKGRENTLYIVTPGTERIGLEICHSGKGTGNNAPKPPNLPQSRYGDATSGEGDCFSQICPNDAIPPRTVKK